jgi:hypothetical protein
MVASTFRNYKPTPDYAHTPAPFNIRHLVPIQDANTYKTAREPPRVRLAPWQFSISVL